jgi:hypothetical protein
MSSVAEFGVGRSGKRCFFGIWYFGVGGSPIGKRCFFGIWYFGFGGSPIGMGCFFIE